MNVIVGNPPFLGDKRMRGELGDDYIEALRHCYAGRVPGGADLVTYWFEKARAQIEAGKCQRAGLVATNSICQKGNRPALERICDSTYIFNAWSDEEWINDGAAVRVSLVCFGVSPRPLAGEGQGEREAVLNGQPVAAIHADLTAGNNMTEAIPLKENAGWSYFGLCLAGAFKVPSATALAWLKLHNPHGKRNSDVLKPIYNGSDITRRWAGDDELMLVRETENKYDSRAVRVEWQGHKLGYVPRVENASISHLLDHGQQLRAEIVGLQESHNPWDRVAVAVSLVV